MNPLARVETRSGRPVNGVKKLPESMSPRGEIGHALFREQQDASGRLRNHPSYVGYYEAEG